MNWENTQVNGDKIEESGFLVSSSNRIFFNVFKCGMAYRYMYHGSWLNNMGHDSITWKNNNDVIINIWNADKLNIYIYINDYFE